MYKLQPQTLLKALNAMARTVPILPTTTKKDDAGNKLPDWVRQKKARLLKRSKQKVGDHFKPTFKFYHEGKPMTPAIYRRSHMNKRKSRTNGHDSFK